MSRSIELSFSPEQFERDYEKRPFYLRHNLAEHPLFSWDALIDLANRLPPENLEVNAGDVPASLPEGKRPDHGFSAVEVLRQIEACNTWLGLKRIETIPEYRAVIEEVLEIVRPHIEPAYTGMHSVEGFVFVTSPNSTVPFHMDPEHNFLFQLRGNKHFVSFPREAMREEDFERHYVTWERRMELPEVLRAKATDLLLEPGQALHVPINSPHFVRNDDQVSISVSITFQTQTARRREVVYKINGRMRKLGLQPAPFGTNRWRDTCKVSLYNALTHMGVIRLSGRRN